MHPFENPGSAKCYRAECRRTPLQETCKQHALRPGRGTLSDWRGFHAFSGRRIELCDLAKAIGLGIVRSGDKRSAHFRTVPAGYDAKPKRLFCRNVTRRKVLHGGYTFKLAFDRSTRAIRNGYLKVMVSRCERMGMRGCPSQSGRRRLFCRAPCALSLRLAIAFSREIGRVRSKSPRLALYSALS
jgi:hypothetical protein